MKKSPSIDKNAHANDAIIGRVFKISVITVSIITLLILAIIYLPGIFKSTTAYQEAPVPAPLIRHNSISPPKVKFTDITQHAGINFTHINGAKGEKLLPETMGSGVAFFDYDNDTDQDLLFINSTLAPHSGLTLYQNNGQGQFTDVTEASGLNIPLYGMGVAVGDYDNDGYSDIFVTTLGQNYLLKNNAGRFTNVTASAHVAGDADTWSSSASFIDIDNDGDLDLFVANYVHWNKQIDNAVNFRLTGVGRAYGPPTAFAGHHSYLYLNNGEGSFSDISASSGIQINNPATHKAMGKALAIAPIDIDHDGLMDLLVANDTVQNFFFHNLGKGHFEEVGTLYGIAFDSNGSATGAMGVDAAHYRNDQDLGFAIGNFANEMTSFYVTQNASLLLTDEANIEGIGSSSRLALTFGLFFFDYDLDGRLDLLHANGHLENKINQVQSSQHYKQSAQLFWNCGNQCSTSFLTVAKDSMGDLSTPIVGRGASYADIDADGDLDVIMTNNAGQALLLRNDQALSHHWLRVKLEGTSVNKDAIGSWVELHTQDQIQRRQVMPTRSYLSQVELPITFGLDKTDRIKQLKIIWSDGTIQTLIPDKIDTLLVIKQNN